MQLRFCRPGSWRQLAERLTSPLRANPDMDPATSAGLRVWSPRGLILTVALPLSLFFVVAQPAWMGHDESVHFARAWQMAGGEFFETPTADGLASEVPVEYLEDLTVVAIAMTAHQGPTFEGHGDLLGHWADSGETTLLPTWATNVSSPLPYLPVAVAMVPLRAVNAPSLWLLWAGRLGAVVAYLSLALLAVQMADRWQWTIAGLTLFPPMLVQGATLGYDAVTLGAVLLAIAMSSRLRSARSGGAFGLLTAGLLLALAKPPYYLLMAPVAVGLFARRRWMSSLAAAAPVGIGLGWSLLLAPDFDDPVNTIMGTIHPDPGTNLAALLADPAGFLWHGVGGVLRSVPFEHLPSWAFADTPVVVAWIGLAVTLMVALAGGRGPDSRPGDSASTSERVVALAAAALVVTAITAAEYLYFTAPGADGSAAGFGHLTPQWRYLAPLLGPLLVATPRLPRIPAGIGYPLVVAGAAASAVGYLMALS